MNNIVVSLVKSAKTQLLEISFGGIFYVPIETKKAHEMIKVLNLREVWNNGVLSFWDTQQP